MLFKRKKSLVATLAPKPVSKPHRLWTRATQAIVFFKQSPQENQLVGKEEKPRHEVSVIEKKINQWVFLSFTSFAMTVIGALFYPPFTLMALPIAIYLIFPIYQDAYDALFKQKRVRMAVVDTVVITFALLSGQYIAVTLASSLVFLGRKLLLKTEDRSQKGMTDLFSVQQTSVWVLSGDTEVETSFDVLQKGDIIVVHAGETIPVDGVITSGIASIDQHILTGESQSVEKIIGEQVFASTTILTGQLYIEVEVTGEETTVAQIGQILERTTDYKMTIQSRGEKIVDGTSGPVLGLGAISSLFLGPLGALSMMTSCAALDVRIVAPLSMLTYLNLMIREGILIKDGRVLDLLNNVDTLVFDKTGTLTLPKPHVTAVHLCCERYSENQILTYAAAAEYKQTHPIALAILDESHNRQLHLPEIQQTDLKIGYGLVVMIDGCQVRVGSKRFMQMENVPIPEKIEMLQARCHENGASLVMVAIEEQLAGMIELHTTIRPEAKEVIKQLRSYIPSMYIISGDHETPTHKLAETLEIDHYYAETLPEQKASLIADLQASGRSVCYIGDGINDSIALKQADVSISLQGASAIATDTAQIILMHENLNQLQSLFQLANQYVANMNKTLLAKMAPALIGVPGAFFFHFSLTTAIILNNIGLAASMVNAIWPLVKQNTAISSKSIKAQSNS